MVDHVDVNSLLQFAINPSVDNHVRPLKDSQSLLGAFDQVSCGPPKEPRGNAENDSKDRDDGIVVLVHKASETKTITDKQAIEKGVLIPMQIAHHSDFKSPTIPN
jgi:hypothetical protein